MKRPTFILVIALLLLTAAMVLKGELISLPQVRGDAAAGTFDTERALARLARILGNERPHPVDTEANDGFRARLIGELRAAGLTPEVTDDIACNGRQRSIACARVRNVLVTVGPTSGQHVLVVSHYDSTPVGPGAADDGIGVATMIETAALLARRKLERPVTFLFNEGEEAGLLGARAFLERNPLAGRVSSLVNLEARGVNGPAVMFETSSPNAPAIAHYQRSADRPAANSLSIDFYKMIPNSTDVAVFDERDWTILNFAIIGNETRYHSPGDTLSALEPRSVQHMGDQALAVVADLANRSTDARGTSIFADLVGRTLIVLPLEVGLMLLALLLLVHAYCAWGPGLGRSALAIAAALPGSAALTYIGQSAVGLFRPGEFWRAHPEIISAAMSVSAMLACLAAILWIARRVPAERLRRSFWLVFLVIGGALTVLAPGALIFFLFPPLVMAIGYIAGRWITGAERVGAIAAALLLFLTLGPILSLMEILLDHDASFVFAPVAALILLPALIELKPIALAATPTRAVGGAALLAALGWTAAGLAPAYSVDRKQKFGIEYVWDAAEKKGRWMIVNDGAPLPDLLPAAERFQSGIEVPWSTRKRWAAPADLGPVAPPSIERVSEQVSGDTRRIRLRLKPNGAENISLEAPPQAGLIGFRAAGWTHSFAGGKPKNDYAIRCRGRSCDGFTFEVIAPRKPIDMTVIGIRSALPAAAAPLVAARPSDAAPQYNPDAVIALDRFRL